MTNKREELKKNGINVLTDEEGELRSSQKYTFQCCKNHSWTSRLDNVFRSLKRASKGCPSCAKQITDNLSQEAVAKNLLNGHKIISYRIKKIKNDGTKERFYKVECPHGHQYEKRTPCLQEGCPQCSIGVFVGEERVKVMFETHFNKPFVKTRPTWFKNPNTNARLELDGYNDDLKIAFEYQGRQHFSDNTQFAGGYEEQSKRDILKIDLCNKNGVKLYIINQVKTYAEDKFINDVMEQLKEQGLELDNNLVFDFSQINEDISLKNKYTEFKTLVEQNNLTLVSNSLSTMQDTLDFKCEKDHAFQLTGLKFKEIIKGIKGRNYLCVECEKLNEQTKAAFRSSISLEDVQNFAKSIGYQLISSKYVGVNEYMDWKCNNGHVFRKNYRSFQRNKTGVHCDECLKEKLVEKKIKNDGLFKSSNGEVITFDTVSNFAKSIGYEMLSTKYENISTPMKWKCANGHIFEKSFRAFKRNKTGCYCDICKQNGIVENNQYKRVVKTNNGEKIDSGYLEKFAKERNLEWIETEYKNVNTPMNWKCKNSHIFTETLRNIQRKKSGLYCSFCNK